MTVLRNLFVFLVFFFAGFAGSAIMAADSHALESLYGDGVHAFFSKNYPKALQIFDSMKTQGTDDPRPFFFCGLIEYRQGNEPSATQNFQHAATLELAETGRGYSVPKALERIQGKERQVIEKVRREAKKKWENDQSLRQKSEFEARQSRDRVVYNKIVRQGTGPVAVSPKTEVMTAPFGAKSIVPFGVVDSSAKKRVTAQTDVADDNVFKSELEKMVILPENTEKKQSRVNISVQADEKYTPPTGGTQENEPNPFD